MGQTIKGLYKLSRPLSTLTGVLAVVLGGYVAGTGAWDKIALAALATLLAAASANAWNDYRDIDIDRINQPQRPLPSGMVSLRAALIFSIVLATLSIVLAALISPIALAIAVGSIILLYVYSVWLKSTVLLGNATVALISALSPIFGGVAAGNAGPSLWLGAIVFVGIFAREVLKTLADYEGDNAHNVRTISTAVGPRAARTVFFFLLGMTAAVTRPPAMKHAAPAATFFAMSHRRSVRRSRSAYWASRFSRSRFMFFAWRSSQRCCMWECRSLAVCSRSNETFAR